jgi:hypothetical protein
MKRKMEYIPPSKEEVLGERRKMVDGRRGRRRRGGRKRK